MGNRRLIISLASLAVLFTASCADPVEVEDLEDFEPPRGLAFAQSNVSPTGMNTKIILKDMGTGEEQILAEGTRVESLFSFSPDGESLVYVRDSPAELVLANADGSNPRVLAATAELFGRPDWSPDGRHIVYTRLEAGERGFDVWIMEADGSDQTLLFDSGEGTNAYGAQWSPDGERILFGGSVVWNRFGGITLMSPATGEISTVPFPPDSVSDMFCGPPVCIEGPTWATEDRIAFVAPHSEGFDIWTMDTSGANVQRLTDGGGYVGMDWSLDGQQIAVEVDEFGSGADPRVHILSPDGEFQQDIGLGGNPVWRQ